MHSKLPNSKVPHRKSGSAFQLRIPAAEATEGTQKYTMECRMQFREWVVRQSKNLGTTTKGRSAICERNSCPGNPALQERWQRLPAAEDPRRGHSDGWGEGLVPLV